MGTRDDDLGMAWWNMLGEDDRAAWLEHAGSAAPVDAWRAFKSRVPGRVRLDTRALEALRAACETVQSWRGPGRSAPS